MQVHTDGSVAQSAGWQAVFGPFRLSPGERLLEREGIPIRLGGRALDILIALVAQAGQTVTKRDLLQRVWPNVVVEEGSLRFHMVAVRKALSEGESGARYIANVAGRGYTFVADVEIARGQPQHAESNAPALRNKNLPALASPLVGRDEVVASLLESLLQSRFVTIVGPGGIGKTGVAITTAHAAMAKFAGDVAFVDFSGVSDPALACSTIARVLGAPLHAADEQESLIAFLERRRMLLVLDCCEHVVDAVAAATEGINSRTQDVCVLATSREPLRVSGEHVYRLAPLAYPAQVEALTAQQALAYPAVKLFVDRASAAVSGFHLTDAETPLVAKLCRELDGIALAIELAAGRLEAYGVKAIADHLDKRMKLMWHGRRTAVPRQQTMGATLDWSHNLLTDSERAVLRRLAVFAGGFTLEAAAAVASIGCSPEAVLEDLASLVSKSLVNVDAGGAHLRYVLLDTTRAYSHAKLTESSELEDICNRHAQFFANWLHPLALDPDSNDLVMAELDNLRGALEWSLVKKNDPFIAAKLAVVICPALLRISLLAECVRWAQTILQDLPSEFAGKAEEMVLQGALGQSLTFTLGNSTAAETAFQRGIALAAQLDVRYQLHLLNGYGVFLHRAGRFSDAVQAARQALALVPEVPDSGPIVDSLLGTALHFVGENDLAAQHWQRAISSGAPHQINARAQIGFDHHVRALCGITRSLWMAGKYADAAVAAGETIALGKQVGHPATYCIALIWAGSVFMSRGESLRFEHTISELQLEAGKHSFTPYLAVAAGLRGQLQVSQGAAALGVASLRQAIERLHLSRYEMLTSIFLTALADGLRSLSQLDESLAVCRDAIARIERQGDLLHLPEALAVQGRVLCALQRPQEAHIALAKSFALARSQSSKPAELAAAIALYELNTTFSIADGAREALQVIVEESAGEECTALEIARQILDQARPVFAQKLS